MPALSQNLDQLLAAQDIGPVQLVHSRVDRRRVTFCVPDRQDPIVRRNRAGSFYELRELRQLQGLVPRGATIFDVGSNIGNHALYFAMVLGAKQVIPIEPNKLCYDVLISNVMVNGVLGQFDLSYLGVGASDVAQGGFAMEQRARNQGAARMLPGAGDLRTIRLDSIATAEAPALIKIDVEGMELNVLRGLSGILAQASPVIMVEVDNTNAAPFARWVEEHGYQVHGTYRRYKTNVNYLLTRT